MAKKKRVGFSVRTILLILTAVLVGWVIYANWPDILETFDHLQETNVFILLLLIPEQLFMYFACGQIFFSYLKHRRNVAKFSNKEILSISTELNFVNHAVPAGGIGGLAFLTYRLGEFGVTAGQASFLYLFRYAVTTIINYAQALIAVIVLLTLGLIPPEAYWVIPVALLMNLGVLIFLGLTIYVASSKKRIDFFSKTVSRVANSVVKFITFGYKKQVLKDEKVNTYFSDIHESVKIAKDNKKLLKGPLFWGLIYSLCEVGTYYIVALAGKNERKIELIKVNNDWYRVIGVQDIDAYARRDQARPARDAKVGMLPPKLAQILINLCGPLKPGSVVLDPFCGTGVVLQEALLMGYKAYGTDINERMIEYSKKNLEWLEEDGNSHFEGVRSAAARGVAPAARGDGPAGRAPKNELFHLSVGDATSFQWEQPIDAVVCEGYLGKPFSRIPTEMELKEQKQECGAIILGFLKNLAGQIKKSTPVVIAMPAWLRENGKHSRLDILDKIEELGYNVDNKSHEGLLYYREKQIVARDILILRKK